MKILLTGANGFTGRHFAALARQQGHDVMALRANLKDAGAVKEEIQAIQPTHVLHLAALSFIGHADARAYYDVNLFGSINLLDALVALRLAPESILLASSATVYGHCRISPISEEQTPEPSTHYGISKLAMEHSARMYGDKLRISVARPFNYTGLGQSLNFVIPKLVDHFNRRAAEIHLGDIKVEREFNDVRFVCEAYLQLLVHSEPDLPYNICSGKPYTLEYVIDSLARLTGHTIDVHIDPTLLRPNELQSLCGSPGRLHSLLAQHGSTISYPTLAETLQKMLATPRVTADLASAA